MGKASSSRPPGAEAGPYPGSRPAPSSGKTYAAAATAVIFSAASAEQRQDPTHRHAVVTSAFRASNLKHNADAMVKALVDQLAAYQRQQTRTASTGVDLSSAIFSSVATGRFGNYAIHVRFQTPQECTALITALGGAITFDGITTTVEYRGPHDANVAVNQETYALKFHLGPGVNFSKTLQAAVEHTVRAHGIVPLASWQPKVPYAKGSHDWVTVRCAGAPDPQNPLWVIQWPGAAYGYRTSYSQDVVKEHPTLAVNPTPSHPLLGSKFAPAADTTAEPISNQDALNVHDLDDTPVPPTDKATTTSPDSMDTQDTQ